MDLRKLTSYECGLKTEYGSRAFSLRMKTGFIGFRSMNIWTLYFENASFSIGTLSRICFSLFHLSRSTSDRAFSSFFFDCDRLPYLAVDLLTVFVSDPELEPSYEEASLTSKLLLVTKESTDFYDHKTSSELSLWFDLSRLLYYLVRDFDFELLIF